MSPRSNRFYSVVAFSFAWSLATPARAAEPAPDAFIRSHRATSWAFGSTWTYELIPLGTSAALLLGSKLLHQQHSSWGPDRAHPVETSADHWSYATVGGALGLAVGQYVLRAELFHAAGFSTESSYRYALPLLLSDGEAVVAATGLTEMIKKMAGRCRPRAWHNGTCDAGEEDNFKAFPSGHTTIPSALAGVHFVEALREPSSLGNWVFFGGIEAAALSTALLRVKAGAHSWSDVGMGYVIGHVTGALVALAHPRADLRESQQGVRFVNPSFGFGGNTVTFSAVF
jgi:membrane-associated phospholipid phosphatase